MFAAAIDADRSTESEFMPPNMQPPAGSPSRLYGSGRIRPSPRKRSFPVPLAIGSALGLVALIASVLIFAPSSVPPATGVAGLDPVQTGAIPAELDKPGM